MADIKIKNRLRSRIKNFEYRVKAHVAFELGITRCLPKPELTLQLSMAEHCNLNCAGCSHFSPLAEPEFADYEETARDLARLSSLFHGHAKEIRLEGGEPLLHPDLVKFLKMIRENFPDAAIGIVTNGVLILNQTEEFWQACRENNVTIGVTKYPVPLKFKEMEKRAADHGVEYYYFSDSRTTVKTMRFPKMDVKGLQEGRRSFLLCKLGNSCVRLQHGRLYTCPIIPSARHFNKRFGETFKELPEDSIDIYQAGSGREILEFLAKPVPFCRYCRDDKTRWFQPWRQSERKMEEWT